MPKEEEKLQIEGSRFNCLKWKIAIKKKVGPLRPIPAENKGLPNLPMLLETKWVLRKRW